MYVGCVFSPKSSDVLGRGCCIDVVSGVEKVVGRCAKVGVTTGGITNVW